MSTSESSTTGMEPTQRRLVATGMAFGTALAIAVAGYLAIEAPAVAAVAALLSGGGTYFILNYVLSGSLADDAQTESTAGLGGGRQSSGGIHSGAAGFALDLGGVATFALGLALEPETTIALLAGPAAALVAYVVLERVLPQPRH